MIKFPPQVLINRFKPTPGAASVAECIAVYNLALQAPSKGVRADVGSHAGKFAMAAAAALSTGDLYLVDPCFDLTNIEAWAHSVQKKPENMPWDYVNEKDFKEKIAENIKVVSAMEVKPIFIGDYSEKVLPQFNNYSYVFIDSDNHCGEMAIREAKILEDRVVENGIIAFHDVDNQFQDPRNAINYLVSTGKYEEIVIDWKPILEYVKENNMDEGNNSWHSYPDLPHSPNFVGAVRRK